MSSGTVPFGPSTSTVLMLAAETPLLFKDVDPVSAAQESGGGQAGNARPYNRDGLPRLSGTPSTPESYVK